MFFARKSHSRRITFFLSVSRCSFLIFSMMIVKVVSHVLCKKRSVSSQLLSPFLLWLLLLLNRRLNAVSLLPMY